jgi:hypothetical protein
VSEEDWVEITEGDSYTPMLAEKIKLESPVLSVIFIVDDIEVKSVGPIQTITYILVRVDDEET